MNNLHSKESDVSECLEICGDGFNFGINQCDDANLVDYDGCDSHCNVEFGFKCQGGSFSSPDICSDIIPPSILLLSISDDTNQLTIVFDEVIKKKKQLQNEDFELKITRNALEQISFKYQVQQEPNSQFEKINISIKIEQGLSGDGSEILEFKIINPSDFKDISGNELLLSQGQVVLPYFFYLTYEQEAAIKYGSSVMNSSSIIGLGVNVVISIFLGASLEAMWNLINTIQLLNFLPLISVYIPDQMLEMYKLLSFVNGDLDIIEEIYTEYIIKPMELKEKPFNQRFEVFGFDSPRLIALCGVNLFFWFILLTLMLGASLISLFRCSNFSKRMSLCFSGIVRSFFWNGINRLLLESFLDLYLASLLNLTDTNFSTNYSG